MVTKSLDDEIVQLWKELNPAGAFTAGFDEYAGRLFIPSEENIRSALEKVRALRRRAENDLQARILDSMEVTLSFDEPQPVLDDIVGSIFNHLTKEGVNEKHLSSLISSSIKAIDVTQKRFSKNSAAAGTSITNAIEPCAVSPMTRALIWLRAPPYASCASQTVLAHRGRWRRVGARPESASCQSRM